MTDLDMLLAEIEAERISLSEADLSDSQRKAMRKAIDRHTWSHHEIKKLEITSSCHAGFVYVYCVAGVAGDEGTAAELFARSGFHACIGPRGGIKYL